MISGSKALEGERKQVTVLFADLKGSMELLADRDPEEAHFEARCGLPLGEAYLLDGRLEEAHALTERVLALARERVEGR
jgi:hypothetical protein